MALRNVFYDMRYCCVIAVVILDVVGPKDVCDRGWAGGQKCWHIGGFHCSADKRMKWVSQKKRVKAY